MKHGWIVLLLLGGTTLQAQTRIDRGSGRDALDKAQQAYASGLEEKALELLGTVHPNDSVHERALQWSMGVLLDRKEHAQVLVVAGKGMALEGDHRVGFAVGRAQALLKLERYAECLACCDSAIARYPGAFDPRHVKAQALIASGAHRAGVELALENARLFPYQREAHVLLGTTAQAEGRLTMAAMALAMAQVVRFEDEAADGILGYYDGMLGGRLPATSKGVDLSFTNDAFEDLDELLQNLVGMNKKYKSKPALTYPACRQSHLLFSTLVDREMTGAYGSFYAPFIQRTMREGHFEGFVYHLLMNSSVPEVHAQGVKNAAKIKSFRGFIADLLRLTYTSFPEPGKGDVPLLHFYNDDGDLMAKGPGDLLKDRVQGQWSYYAPDGSLRAVGELSDAGKRTGVWREYHPNGKLAQEASYTNGEAQGLTTVYHFTGARSDSGYARNGDFDGMHCAYDLLGTLKNCKNRTNGTDVGDVVEYHPDGSTQWTFQLRNGEPDGLAKAVHMNGKPEYEGLFVNNERQGVHRSWHPNGQLAREVSYKDGKEEGTITSWFTDGIEESRVEMKNGKPAGEARYQVEGGRVSHIERYDDQGEYHGTAVHFNDLGGRYFENDYVHGELAGYRFYDRSGRLIEERRRAKGRFDYKGYHPSGAPQAEGVYLDEGKKDGEWVYRHPDGTIRAVEMFKNGKSVDTDRNFDESGALSLEATPYQRGDVDYIHVRTYHRSGSLKAEWVTKEGELEGVRRTYQPDGRIVSDEYFVDGELHGWQTHYDDRGLPQYAERMFDGLILERVMFDSLGAAYEHKEVPPGAYTMELHYPDGGPYATLELLNGRLHGTCTYFFPDGSIEQRSTMRYGKRHGPWTRYFPNGRKELEVTYEDDLRQGVERRWYMDGTLQQENQYKDNLLHGDQQEHFPSGKPERKVSARYGKSHGRMENRDANGELIFVRYYVEGRLVGYAVGKGNGAVGDTIPAPDGLTPFLVTYPNGVVARKCQYRNGELEGEFLEHHPGGAVKERRQFIAGNNTGTAEQFHPNGKPYLRTSYTDDMEHGERVLWWDNGQVKERSDLVHGRYTGKRRFYDRNGKLIMTLVTRADDVVRIER